MASVATTGDGCLTAAATTALTTAAKATVTTVTRAQHTADATAPPAAPSPSGIDCSSLLLPLLSTVGSEGGGGGDEGCGRSEGGGGGEGGADALRRWVGLGGSGEDEELFEADDEVVMVVHKRRAAPRHDHDGCYGGYGDVSAATDLVLAAFWAVQQGGGGGEGGREGAGWEEEHGLPKRAANPVAGMPAGEAQV